MKLFEYAIIYTPKLTKEQREANETPKAELLLGIEKMLAKDEREVGIVAARRIPDTHLDKLDCIDIAIRPF